MRRGLALLLTATLALSMTACGGSKGAGTQKSEKGDGMTYAVEAGSAGEAVAKEKALITIRFHHRLMRLWRLNQVHLMRQS